MLKIKFSCIGFPAILVGTAVMLMLLSTPATASADGPAPTPNNGNCVVCHEDLYFLHDTGNWFCLKESPMTCTGCHGGDPTATTKEEAHNHRAAHPVVNEDISKCQECHPNECYDRIEYFKQTAGISEVLVAAPYTPSYSTEEMEAAPLAGSQQEPGNMLMVREIIPPALVAGLALVIYLVLRKRRN